MKQISKIEAIQLLDSKVEKESFILNKYKWIVIEDNEVVDINEDNIKYYLPIDVNAEEDTYPKNNDVVHEWKRVYEDLDITIVYKAIAASLYSSDAIVWEDIEYYI